MPSLPATSDGPERFHGGGRCPEHHDGVRDGIVDWCCCCNPCLYERPQSGADALCVRCVPQLVCCKFTPDEEGEECCKPYVRPMVPYYTDPGIVNYDGLFGLRITLGRGDGVTELPCAWRFVSEELGVDETYQLDHVEINSLSFPSIEITGVTDAMGCVGTITFSDYEAVKIPFQNRNLAVESDVDLVDSPCHCVKVAKRICVSGRRHGNVSNNSLSDIESVEFVWDEDLGDRWTYLPPCGDPTFDRETIYLRGDGLGGCLLELDFEQTGESTDDWEDLLPVKFCACGLKARSTRPDGRYVNIHAGHCGRWKHVCGSCRCAPKFLCVVGNIDDETISGVATYEVIEVDGVPSYGWTMPESESTPAIRFVLTADACNGIFTGFSGDCAIATEGDFVLPFKNTDAIGCGKFMSFEVESIQDEAFPNTQNWLWATSNPCGCDVTRCGPCADTRCGSNPKVLYVSFHGRTIPEPPIYPDPPTPVSYCDTEVPVYYWQRWDFTTDIPTMTCGYIGFLTQTCLTDTFQLRVELIDNGAGLVVSRRNLFGPLTSGFYGTSWYPIEPVAMTVGPSSCDPYTFDSGWIVHSLTNCEWGCGSKDEYSVGITE